jgi:Ca2+/Na+ antiporter
MSNLSAIIALSTVVIAIATAFDGIIFKNIWLWRRMGEDRRFSDDYNFFAHGTLTLFLFIYHLSLTCQQLTRRLNARCVYMYVGSILRKEMRPNSNAIIEHDTNVSYEGHEIEHEQADYQDIPMSISKYKVSSLLLISIAFHSFLFIDI